jgi:hypothetical protein
LSEAKDPENRKVTNYLTYLQISTFVEQLKFSKYNYEKNSLFFCISGLQRIEFFGKNGFCKKFQVMAD